MKNLFFYGHTPRKIRELCRDSLSPFEVEPVQELRVGVLTRNAGPPLAAMCSVS